MGNKLIIVAGPTAVGKSSAGIEIAKIFNGEIISADSAQVYKEMNIGTAKLKETEMHGIKHHMIDIIYPDEEFSVSKYKSRVDVIIDDIFSRNKTPIIVGGTGLYINSILNEMEFTVSSGDNDFRNKMQELVNEKGNEFIYNKLIDVDPHAATKLHPNDTRRVIRALEVFELTGEKISNFQENSKNKPDRYEHIYTAITDDRAILYDRINARVDKMLEDGLITEVNDLLNKGYDEKLVSLQAIGYKEIVDYIKGRLTYDNAIELLKQSSRRYAKRQLTWFRRDERIKWFDNKSYTSFFKLIENMCSYVAENI